MRKYLLTIILGLTLITGVAYARSENLWEFFTSYGMDFPSISERAVVYEQIFDDTYKGTVEQNNKFLSYLREVEKETIDEYNNAKLGGSVDNATVVSFFETSLASAISSSATSMTLVSATTKDGSALASSTYGFIIDEGTASEETVIADCTSTACTNMTRGVSSLTGTSTVSTLRKSHRRGASVKITDAPFLVQLSNIVQGKQNIPSILSYTSGLTNTPGTNQIATVSYVDATANAGAATSTETNGGIVELGTQVEMASSTDNGANKPTVVQSKYGTSTPSGTSNNGLYFPVAKNNGKLHQLWLDLTEVFAFSGNNTFSGTQTFTGQNTFSATSTIATTTSTGANFNNNIVNSLTAGETINGATTPQPVYIATSTGTVFISDANTDVDKNFIGFAINNATAGNTSYVQTDGVVGGFTGLTAGLEYYVQDDSTLGTTIGTAEIYVGQAISTTQILIDSKRADQYLGTLTPDTATESVPLYTKTIRISGLYYSDTYTGINLTLKKNGLTSSSVYACDIGTGNCTSNVSYGFTWYIATSSIYTESSGGTSAGITYYFYR